MLGVAALALALAPRDWPHYTAKFVQVAAGFGTHVRINDARPDLSAVGCSWSNMIDVDPSQPVSLMHGHEVFGQIPSKHPTYPLPLVGYRFIGHDSVYAGATGSAWFDSHDPFVVAKREGNHLVVQRKAATPKRFTDAGVHFVELPANKRLPDWLVPEIKRLSTAGYTQEYQVSEAKLPHGFVVQDINYFPITPGYDVVMHDADQWLPAVRFETAHRLLRECVDNAKSFELGDVLWVGKGGWLIVRASKGDHQGLLWLYPKRA